MTRIGNTLFLGGEFSRVGGQPRQGLAALDTISGRVLAWNPGLPASGKTPRVRAMTASPTTVFVTGEFAQVGGVKRVVLAAIHATTGQVTAFDARYAADLVRPASQGPVYAIAWSSRGLLVAGDYNSIGGASRYGFAALDPATGNALSWNIVSGNEVHALCVRGNLLYIGGSLVVYNAYGQAMRHNLAAIDLSTGAVNGFNPAPTGTLDPNSGIPAGRVDRFDIFDSKMLVYGNFITIGGQSRSGVAVLELAGGKALTWAPPAAGNWYGLTDFTDSIIAGCLFFDIGRPPRWELWALDPATGRQLGWSPDVNGEVSAIATKGSAVYICGSFTTINGSPRRGFACFGPQRNGITQWKDFH